MYILGFYWKESSPVTSQLINGYVCRALSSFCENLTSHSFAVPDYQSRKTKIHNFTYHTSRRTVVLVRLLVHLFRSADTVRVFKLEMDLCPHPTLGMLNFLLFFLFWSKLILSANNCSPVYRPHVDQKSPSYVDLLCGFATWICYEDEDANFDNVQVSVHYTLFYIYSYHFKGDFHNTSFNGEHVGSATAPGTPYNSPVDLTHSGSSDESHDGRKPKTRKRSRETTGSAYVRRSFRLKRQKFC